MKSNQLLAMRGCCLAVFLVLDGPTVVAAQYPSRETWKPSDKPKKGSDPSVSVAYWTSKGKPVRVSLADQSVELRSAVFEADHMTVDIGSQQIPIYYDHIQTVEYRGSAWKRGGLIGAISYGTLSLIGGISLENDNELTWGEVALGTAFGFGIGYAVGALIGAPFKQWNTVYETKHDSRSLDHEVSYHADQARN